MLKIIENKLAINSAQKCGSRTVIAYAYLLKNPDEYEKTPEKFYSEPAPGRYDYTVKFAEPLSIYYLEAFRQNYKKRIAIVREPVSRFLSAYVNRSGFYTGTEKLEIDEFIDLYDVIPGRPKHHWQINYSDKMHVYADIKFHITPLVKRYGKNNGIYTDIFNLSQMDKMRSIIEELSETKLPDLKLNKSSNEKNPQLTDSQKKWIVDTFKEDIEVYGKWM
jgi:hypothetical protein